MIIWVAYDDGGNLIAEGDSYLDVADQVEALGLDESDVIIGKVTL